MSVEWKRRDEKKGLTSRNKKEKDEKRRQNGLMSGEGEGGSGDSNLYHTQ